MYNKENPIITLANIIESIHQIEPPPLSSADIPSDGPEQIVPITLLDGEFKSCWQEIRNTVREKIDEYGSFEGRAYSSRYIDPTDDSERLTLLQEVWRGDERAVIKIEYYLSGEVKITSCAILHSGEAHNFPDLREEFICKNVRDISLDDITSAKQRLLDLQN